MASIRTSQWSIDDVIITSRGSKVAEFKDGQNGNCVFTPTSYLRVPLEPKTFDRDPTASRLNLVLECDSAIQEELDAFDT